MTSLWTNMECIYSMPGVGANNASAVVTCMSAAAAEPIILANLWSTGNILGKSLHFRGSGTYDIAGAYTNVFEIGADTTRGTYAAAGAASGACAAVSTTTVGTMRFEVDAVCVTAGSATTGWIFDGWVEYAASASTTASLRYNVGNVNVAGVATAVALVPLTPYYFEVFFTWSTAAAASYLNTYKIYAEN
jgi:hypothetical protein